MTASVALRAYADSSRAFFATIVHLYQEYLPQLWYSAVVDLGTERLLVESSAKRLRNEMIFEHVVPSCYLREPFTDSLGQSASAGRAWDDMPAEDMHRAILKISEVHAEICEMAKRIVASPPRNSRHDKKADGMSAGG